MTEAEKCLLDLRNRLALIHDLCCGTAPKQSVGELVYVMLDMPEWDVVRAALAAAAPAQAEPTYITEVRALGDDMYWITLSNGSKATVHRREQPRVGDCV